MGHPLLPSHPLSFASTFGGPGHLLFFKEETAFGLGFRGYHDCLLHWVIQLVHQKAL